IRGYSYTADNHGRGFASTRREHSRRVEAATGWGGRCGDITRMGEMMMVLFNINTGIVGAAAARQPASQSHGHSQSRAVGFDFDE
ncbi:hypothetical protein NECAME_18353, partial [Necator americanus]